MHNIIYNVYLLCLGIFAADRFLLAYIYDAPFWFSSSPSEAGFFDLYQNPFLQYECKSKVPDKADAIYICC